MSDPISRVISIPPTYPVKPAQPSKKDREAGRKSKPVPKNKPRKEPTKNPDVDNDGEQPTIDEYI